MENQPQNPELRNNPENFHPWDKGLSFGLCLHLHPYFVYTSSDGSGESAHMRRLPRAFTARWWDYQNLMHWPI